MLLHPTCQCFHSQDHITVPGRSWQRFCTICHRVCCPGPDLHSIYIHLTWKTDTYYHILTIKQIKSIWKSYCDASLGRLKFIQWMSQASPWSPLGGVSVGLHLVPEMAPHPGHTRVYLGFGCSVTLGRWDYGGSRGSISNVKRLDIRLMLSGQIRETSLLMFSKGTRIPVVFTILAFYFFFLWRDSS